jgi:hypothetical protein
VTATATAYCKAGRLCVIGIDEDDELGPIPFAHSLDVGDSIADGAVDLGAHEELGARVESELGEVINKERQRLGAEELVERSRAGDQNAMAMIEAVREGAEEHQDATATSALAAIRLYIEQTPHEADEERYQPKKREPIIRSLRELPAQGEPDYALAVSSWAPSASEPFVAGVALSMGPTIGRARVDEIRASFENASAFGFGYSNFGADEAIERACEAGDREQTRAIRAGQIVGLARTLQGVQNGHLPVSRLDPGCGWELGE